MKKIIIILLLGVMINCCDFSQQKKNVIILATSPDYPPFEFKKDDKNQGFDIDLARLLAERNGYKLEIKEFEFSSLIPALKAGKADFVMAGLSPTPERLVNVNFSDIYYQDVFAIITRKGEKINKIQDLKDKRIGAQLGSQMEKILNEQVKRFINIDIIALTNNMHLIQELKLNRIDGLMVGRVQAESFVKNDHKLTYTLLNEVSGEGSAIAFPKGSKLVDQFNLTLKQLKESGEIDKLIKKWLVEDLDNKTSLINSLKTIPIGMIVTLKYAGISVFFGFIIGAILAIFKVGKKRYLRIIAGCYTSIFRGTPLLVQLSFVYFAVPSLFNVELSVFAAGIIAFSLNSSAYVSEIIRAGIIAVDRGQFEAAKALGMPSSIMMSKIIMPQAITKILPSLINEMINLLKESAIISVIGEADIMRRAQIVAAEHYTYFEPIMVAAICYYIMVLILSYCAKFVENKLRIK